MLFRSFPVTVSDSGPGNLSDSGTLRVVTVPRFRAVINEVLYRPDATNAAFVELFNPSTLTTQDLSGIRLLGENLRYAFPAGARLEPGKFMVLAQNRSAFTQRYPGVAVAGEWSGVLDRFGTRLALVGKDANDKDVVLQQVDYRASLPWPTNADVPGVSLQLRDARRDGSRVGNWDAGNAGGWKYVVQSGTASSSTLYLYLENIGDAYIDDIKLVAGNVPEVGDNFLANGDFESPFPGPFTVSPNLSDTVLSTTVKHGGNASLRLVANAPGTTRGSSVFQDLATPLTSGAPYTLSYWYLPNPAGGTLTLRLSGSGIRSTVNLAPDGAVVAKATPGTTNSTAVALPEFPPVWINEVVPDNRGGLADAGGSVSPWVELVNAGGLPADLSGWTLSNTYTNAAAWAFPQGTQLPAYGFLVVFLDGKTAGNAPGELHATFRPGPTNGLVALYRPQLGAPALVDAMEYAGATPDTSLGLDPMGFPFFPRTYALPTPGAPNRDPIAPPRLAGSVSAEGNLILSWPGVVGATYRVETRETLSSPWRTMVEFKAASEALTASDAIGARSERYYRVVIP